MELRQALQIVRAALTESDVRDEVFDQLFAAKQRIASAAVHGELTPTTFTDTQRAAQLRDRIRADCVRGDDGFYHYCCSGGGYLTAAMLRAIAVVLDELNADYAAQVELTLTGGPPDGSSN